MRAVRFSGEGKMGANRRELDSWLRTPLLSHEEWRWRPRSSAAGSVLLGGQAALHVADRAASTARDALSSNVLRLLDLT